jgi:hypothetical protein
MVMSMTFVNEVFFTLHVARVSQSKEYTAAAYGAMVYLISGINVLNYVEYKWIAITAACIGGYIGTLLIMKWDNKWR